MQGFPIISGIQLCRERLREIATAKEVSGFEEQEESVRAIIEAVRSRGDAALMDLTREFDRVELSADQLRVTTEEVQGAREWVGEDFVRAAERARERIESFHRKRIPGSWLEYCADGVSLGQKVTPLQRVGIYVPGGKANYPSTVLMTAVPAKVAGVEEIVVVCPPGDGGKISPHVLVAADIAGVNEIYRVGGAQAVAALAYGTEAIRRVDKIVGPGNTYVVLAKKLLFGVVGIESLPGPSEVVVLADESARPEFIAADLMAQAEHGPDSCSLLITTSAALAEAVADELEKAVEEAERADLIRESFRRFGGALVVESLEEAFELLNEAAPEHAQLSLRDAWEHLSRVRNAGAIFVGEYSTVPLGDYLAGPSHVLPTATTARFASALNAEDFVKRSSIVAISKSATADLAPDLAILARAENLPAHARAVEVRVPEERSGEPRAHGR